MDNFEEELSEGFSVNIHKLVSDTSLLAVTRLLAADMIARPYMAIGDFFKNLSDSDLQLLLKAGEPNEQDEVMDDVLLIGMMLRSAEGLASLDSVKGAKSIVEQVITLLVLESLYRKKMIKLYHENMSFGEDAGDKIVCEKIDGLDYKDFL